MPEGFKIKGIYFQDAWANECNVRVVLGDIQEIV
jgi:hypothetical protein